MDTANTLLAQPFQCIFRVCKIIAGDKRLKLFVGEKTLFKTLFAGDEREGEGHAGEGSQGEGCQEEHLLGEGQTNTNNKYTHN